MANDTPAPPFCMAPAYPHTICFGKGNFRDFCYDFHVSSIPRCDFYTVSLNYDAVYLQNKDLWHMPACRSYGCTHWMNCQSVIILWISLGKAHSTGAVQLGSSLPNSSNNIQTGRFPLGGLTRTPIAKTDFISVESKSKRLIAGSPKHHKAPEAIHGVTKLSNLKDGHITSRTPLWLNASIPRLKAR